MKHTKGNWRIDSTQPYKVSVHSPWSMENDVKNSETYGDYRGSLICEMNYNGGVPTKRQAIANAKLISAAPDLLKAILKMKELSDREDEPSEDEFIEVDNMIEAAVKKATE